MCQWNLLENIFNCCWWEVDVRKAVSQFTDDELQQFEVEVLLKLIYSRIVSFLVSVIKCWCFGASLCVDQQLLR